MASLQRTLSFPVLLIIGINSIMGTGVFFLQAIAAGIAGPASIISWGIMACIAIGMSLVFAELSSMFDTAGGVYDYTKRVFGSFSSFLVGWLTILVSMITIATLVVGAIQYLNPSLPVSQIIGISLLFLLIFNFMAYRGMQTSAVMLVAFGIITLSAVLLLLVPGFFFVQPQNLSPFFSFGVIPVFIGVFLVADTFFGWQTITFLAEETQDARRVLPKVFIYSTAIIALLCILFAIVILSIIPWSELSASGAPLLLVSERIYGSLLGEWYTLLIYSAIIGSVAGWIVSSPRLLMALAKDKMFIPRLAEVHPVYNTPHIAILFQTILTACIVFIGAGSYETLLRLSLPLVFLLYMIVIIVLIRMRYAFPDEQRYFSLPGGVLSASLLLCIMIFFVLFWIFYDPTAIFTVLLAGSFLLLGVPIYYLLKFTYVPDSILSNMHFLGRLHLLLENVLLPKSVRAYVLSLVSLSDKHVLEFGGNVGTMTMHIAEQTKLRGRITATEFSSANAHIIRQRMKKAGHSHVTVLHDEHHLNRIHPSIHSFDVLVSVGYLSYLQDMQKILREVRNAIRENGEVLFVEYIDYFKFLPNAGWTSNIGHLVLLFEEQGFRVRILKKKGFFWNYLIVHGIRTDKNIPFV